MDSKNLAGVGIALATVGACTSGLGMNLLRASSKLEQTRPWYKRYRFWIGASLATFVNTTLDSIAFALTPLSVIAPIGGVTIVVSVLLARCGFAGETERVTRIQWVSILAIVLGVVLIDIYGPSPEPEFDTELVLQNFNKPSFIIYNVTTFLLASLIIIGVFLGELAPTAIETTICTAISAGLTSGLTQCMLKVVSVSAAEWTLGGKVPWQNQMFLLALGELVVAAFALFYLLTTCLASADIAISSPFYLANVMIFTIVAGCAFYGDLDMVSETTMFIFALGVVLVVTGLSVLVSQREQGKKRVSTKDADEAEKAAEKEALDPPPPPDLVAENSSVRDVLLD